MNLWTKLCLAVATGIFWGCLGVLMIWIKDTASAGVIGVIVSVGCLTSFLGIYFTKSRGDNNG